MLNNERNINKQGNGNRNESFDDCGAWDSKKSHRVKSHFITDEKKPNIFKVSYVIVKDDVVFTEKREQGKKKLVIINPQPQKDAVVTMHRYYTCLR